MDDAVARLLSAPTPVRVRGTIGEARTPRGHWKQSKFWITNDHVLVFVDQGGAPTLIEHAEIEGFVPPGNIDGQVQRHYAVQTVEGESWELTPTGHCACGSVLRTYEAFPPPAMEGA